MKTTDLIPLVLYQLVDGDKYGYEIVKQIEDSSNGRISIKQPTLYSVLKKLEHGRIISSYWQDSEIGGKRHYYKLTDNGRAQLDTYPSFEQLIKDACDDSPTQSVDTTAGLNLETNETIEDINIEIATTPANISAEADTIVETPVNELSIEHIPPVEVVDENIIKPIKIDISSPINNTSNQENVPTVEPINIFDVIEPASNDIEFERKTVAVDEKVDSPISEIEVETNNSDEESKNSEQNMAFTTNVDPIPSATTDSVLYNKLTPNKDLVEQPTLNVEEAVDTNFDIERVKYLNYVDFSNDKSTIKRRKAITKHILKMSFTCITLLLLFVLNLVICAKYGFSKAFYVCAIIVCAIVVLYPILCLRRVPYLRIKYCSKPFKYVLLHDMLIKLSIFLSIVIVVFAYNISVASSIGSIFRLNNFSQFVTPIMLAATLLFDFAYNALLYKNYK